MSSFTASSEDLYAHLAPELRALAMRGVVRSYPKKAVVINEAEIGDSLFVVLKGSVKVFSMDESGREITFGRIHAGDYFGEMSLDGGPRSASVITVEPCTCAVVNRAEVGEHLASAPEFALSLVMRVIRRARDAASARYRRHDQRVRRRVRAARRRRRRAGVPLAVSQWRSWRRARRGFADRLGILGRRCFRCAGARSSERSGLDRAGG